MKGRSIKRRLYIASTAVIAAVTLGIGLTTVPANAAATYELKTDNGGSSLCMNRDGGGTSNGSNVIAYNCGNNNNDFYYAYPAAMCGNGTVTETCPFTVGSGLNAAYYGNRIVVEQAYSENKCVGGNDANDTSSKLEPCPNNGGTGGGWSTIGVAVYSRGNDPAYYVIVNVHWSDALYGSGGNCYGEQCASVVGAFSGYRYNLSLDTSDSEVQNGYPQNAAGFDVWGEVSY